MGWIIAAVVLVAVVVFLAKPKDNGGGYDSYFASLNQALKTARVGTGRIFIDLDRLDHNLATIRKHIPSPRHYRIVVKSIPCVELLRYIRKAVGTNKFMLVHRPFIKVILENFEAGIDILLGKPLPVFALMEFFEEIPPGLRERAQREVQWLVDTQARLDEYLNCARKHDLRLRINIEIDIGLHRGGLTRPEELDGLLQTIQANPGCLEFSGFMGYEGHVAHAPALFTPARKAALKEFADDMAAYKSFIDYGREHYPTLFEGDLTFNSGGSGTYSLFGEQSFITDIGIGGAVLRPAAYPAHFLHDLLPAEFIATPLLKKIKGSPIPFIEGLAGVLEWWDPNNQTSFVIYGGGWAGDMVAPKGLQVQALTSDPPNQNLVPNQSTINGSARVTLDVGDYVFIHPIQSDAMFQFEDILLVRNCQVTGTWAVFDRRY